MSLAILEETEIRALAQRALDMIARAQGGAHSLDHALLLELIRAAHYEADSVQERHYTRKDTTYNKYSGIAFFRGGVFAADPTIWLNEVCGDGSYDIGLFNALVNHLYRRQIWPMRYQEHDILDEPSRLGRDSGIRGETLLAEHIRNIALHVGCGHSIEMVKMSRTHVALICRHCLLRIPIPATVATYRDLAKYLAETHSRAGCSVSEGGNQ